MRTLFFVAALLAATPARAEILNLSCDDGGMLLLIDTDKATVSDKNPFQKTEVTVPLTITQTAYTWREIAGGVTEIPPARPSSSRLGRSPGDLGSFAAAPTILRRLAQIFDALPRIKTARTVLRRAAVKLWEAP